MNRMTGFFVTDRDLGGLLGVLGVLLVEHLGCHLTCVAVWRGLGDRRRESLRAGRGPDRHRRMLRRLRRRALSRLLCLLLPPTLVEWRKCREPNADLSRPFRRTLNFILLSLSSLINIFTFSILTHQEVTSKAFLSLTLILEEPGYMFNSSSVSFSISSYCEQLSQWKQR